MSVGFVVLTWNSESYIRQCLDSIVESGLDARAVIVENGSMDGTPAIINQYESAYSYIQSVRLKENRGTTVTRNMGIKKLMDSVDYICILDSDAVINREAIEKMVSVLELDSTIGVVGPTMVSANGVEQLSGRNLPTLGIKLGKALGLKSAEAAELPDSPVCNGLQDVGYLLSACWLVPARVFGEVGLLDEDIFYAPEDVDWCLRCHEAGYRVVRAWDASIIHDYQRLSHKKLVSKTNFEHVKGLVHYFAKHGYLLCAPVYTK